jgi:hypothetical protein
LEEDFKKVHELLALTATKNGSSEDAIHQNLITPIQAPEVNLPMEVDQNDEIKVQNSFEEQKLTSTNESPIDVTNSTACANGQDLNKSNNEVVQSYKTSYGDFGGLKKKAKRGRKKKNRPVHDGETDSDSDLFNYDKFLRRVSKKGTRVHMNVRMYALRSLVPGCKAVLLKTPKVEPNTNVFDLKTSIVQTKNLQKHQKKIAEAEKQAEKFDEQDYENSQSVQSSSKKKSNKEYFHAGEDFYNTEGYETGRYNLRKRATSKKYYDDDPELVEDPEMIIFNAKVFETKKLVRTPSQPIGMAQGYALKLQSKLKRKKKEDDEDYTIEEEAEVKNMDQPPSGNFKQYEQRNFHQNGMQQFGNPNAPQITYMMQSNAQPQFNMGGKIQHGNQISKFNHLLLLFEHLKSLLYQKLL